jgi:hypothetical protein
MAAYARVVCVENGTVTEYPVRLQDGFTLADSYHPEFVAVCITVPDGTTAGLGWTYEFAAPRRVVTPPVDMKPLAQVAFDKSDVTLFR